MQPIPPTYLTKEKAEAIAEKLNADDQDGWAYKAVPVTAESKYYKVLTFDESGEEIGAL